MVGKVLGSSVGFGAGTCAVLSWFACCLGCIVVWALLDMLH